MLLLLSMGVKSWKAGGSLLLVLPNITALLLLAGTFLMLNWSPISIKSSAVKLSHGSVQMEQLGELTHLTVWRIA
jgi:hypothetical protein